ncbi:MAG: cytochrome c [Alphaproteobacteria bacterium]|nr:cytochrome c [Alphaproteobacteria bacterium]
MRIAAIGVLSGLALSASTLVTAAMADVDSIKLRRAVMGSIATHMGALGPVAKGEVAMHDEVPWHAGSIARLSAHVVSLFPEGTGEGDTDAKPEIWKDWAKFEEAAANFEKAASALADAGGKKDQAALGAAMGEVGKTCGACHDLFRKPQQ